MFRGIKAINEHISLVLECNTKRNVWNSPFCDFQTSDLSSLSAIKYRATEAVFIYCMIDLPFAYMGRLGTSEYAKIVKNCLQKWNFKC